MSRLDDMTEEELTAYFDGISSQKNPEAIKEIFMQKNTKGVNALMLAATRCPEAVPGMLGAIASLPIKDQTKIYGQLTSLEPLQMEEIKGDPGNEKKKNFLILTLNAAIHEKLEALERVIKVPREGVANPASTLRTNVNKLIS
jgi:hypothetical protein